MFLRLSIVILICVSAIQFASANCNSHGLSVWPPNGEITSNSIIIIDTYMQSQSIIEKLIKGHEAYLTSSTGKVPLIIEATYKGQFRQSQAILRPNHALSVGETYTLHINGLDPKSIEESLEQYNYTTNKFEAFAWKVSAYPKDTIVPHLKNTPVFAGYEYEMYGCGPEEYLHYNLNLSSIDTPVSVLVKMMVINTSTSEKITCYLISEVNSIYVGHGMCYGAFTFEAENTYMINMSLIKNDGSEFQNTNTQFIYTIPKASER